MACTLRTLEHTPEMNCISERFNKTIVNSAKAMMHYAGLSNKCRGEAIMAATYLRNLCPSSSLSDKVLIDAWQYIKPSLEHLRIIGSECWVLDPRTTRKKQDGKVKKGIFN